MFFIAAMTDVEAALWDFRYLQESQHFHSLHKLMTVQIVVQIMRVAAARCHVEMLQYLVAQPAAKQIPAAAMESLITDALFREAAPDTRCTYLSQFDRDVLQVLCKAAASAAEQIDAAAGLQLLQTALELCERSSRSYGVMLAVCSLPAVKQLDLATVEPLIQQAVGAEEGKFQHSSNWYALAKLLPAATQLSSASMHKLLQGAVQRGCCDLVSALLRLPAARRLEPAAVADLLRGSSDRKPQRW
jgi:hypothetical protein